MSVELLLDVSHFSESESDLQALLRELIDSEILEKVELCEPKEVMRGAKGGMFDQLKLLVQPEKIKTAIRFISDTYWRFIIPPRFKLTVKTIDGKVIQIEVNRKEDLEDILEKL